MQIKRAFISAFKNRVFLPNFQKDNKKKKEITPSSFFTTISVGYLFSFTAAIKSNAITNRVAGFMFIFELK